MRLKSQRVVVWFLISLTTSITIFSELTYPGTAVTCIRFIERKQWIVAGTEDGYLHVYSYETRIQKITSLRVGAIENLESRAAHTHLAIHPTQPYLLSVYGFKVKLWDWDVGWECIQTFENEELMTILRVAFNPNDTFATASMDCTVEVCHPSPLLSPGRQVLLVDLWFWSPI